MSLFESVMVIYAIGMIGATLALLLTRYVGEGLES